KRFASNKPKHDGARASAPCAAVWSRFWRGANPTDVRPGAKAPASPRTPEREIVLEGWERCSFMASLLSLLSMPWDHELWKAPASRTHSKRFAKSQALGHRAAAFGVRGACSRFCTRFMESAHRDHEPTLNPSQEGNSRRADESQFPSWEGLGVGWSPTSS